MDRLILVLLVLASCRSIPKPVLDPEASATQKGTLPAQEEAITPVSDGNLPDPDARELNRLSTWLAAQETGFDLERLEDCEAQLLVRADQVQTKGDIQKAANDLQADVRDTLALYHWCYYHMLSRLEYQLEQQNLGRTYQDKIQQFLRESKALFVVAECLDRSRQTRRYRANLQKKYVALSQAWFGRNLSPLDPSNRTDMNKSAAPYEEK